MRVAYCTYKPQCHSVQRNKRRNGNLEQQAQALFKAWFVDFEPFKSGKFVDSELGKIPAGWKVVELSKVTTQEKEKVGIRSDVKVLSPVTTGKLMLSEEYFTKQVFSDSIAKYILVKPNSFAYNQHVLILALWVEILLCLMAVLALYM